MKKVNKKWEDIFFNRLAEKLEDLYPKGIAKDRSKALVFNAYANIIFREIIKKINEEK